jgi:hypothetical protein
MRMLSGEEAPDAGERVEGHNVVMQYFAQDEATRMDRIRPSTKRSRPVRRFTWCQPSGTSWAVSVLWRRRVQTRARAVGR